MLTRLRVEFSSLNEHRFRHNFECLSPACICGAAKEDTEHYFLHCPQFSTLRQTLRGQISDVGYDKANMTSKGRFTLVAFFLPLSCREPYMVSVFFECSATSRFLMMRQS